MYDIHVCRTGELVSVTNRNVTYIKESVVTIESEFAKDTFEVSVDFSKLVCRNSRLKIMIISKCSREDDFCESLIKIASNVTGDLYLITLPHPSAWKENQCLDYSIHFFINDSWSEVHYLINIKRV